MTLKYPVRAGTGDFMPVPAGSHIAVCDLIADIGLQPGSQLFPKPRPQVYIRWELPNERTEFEKDGKKVVGPQVIGKLYTASMNEKATLRHHLESWRGRAFTDEEAEDFDVGKCLGVPCMITVTHSEKGERTYANITGVGPLPKGIERKTIIPETLPLLYTPESEKNVYNQLPEWLRKKIDEQIVSEKAPNPDAQRTEDDPFITDNDLPSEMFGDDSKMPDDFPSEPALDSSIPF